MSKAEGKAQRNETKGNVTCKIHNQWCAVFDRCVRIIPLMEKLWVSMVRKHIELSNKVHTEDQLDLWNELQELEVKIENGWFVDDIILRCTNKEVYAEHNLLLDRVCSKCKDKYKERIKYPGLDDMQEKHVCIGSLLERLKLTVLKGM